MTHAATPAPAHAKAPGLEPLPGYRLIEPLGRGGFGEVWKCEAPGGLHKAVKFVAPDPDDPEHGGHSLRQEYEAFQQIKAIRHPFLLTLERVELVGGELVMVMELADQHLQDRFCECAATGLPGVPRDELIGYMAEAAEALDVISTKHGLQHLDVKPANLFVTAGHAKVGDYGLVARFEAGGKGGSVTKPARGLTPRYVAPEVIKGRVDPRSDQYSLALVYFEMLTGAFPFAAKNAPQMLLQHAMAVPDLSALADADRPAVARALAKDPADRFPSCLDFVRALLGLPQRASGPVRVSGVSVVAPKPPAKTDPPTTRPSYRLDQKTPPQQPHPAPRAPHDLAPTNRPAPLRTVVPRLTPPHLRVPGRRPVPPAAPDLDGDGMVELISASGPRSAQGEAADQATMAADVPAARYHAPGLPVTKLDRIRPVTSAVRLEGADGDPPGRPSAAEFVDAVVRAAAGGQALPRSPGDPYRLPDGRWGARVLMKAVGGVVRLKMAALAEQWGAELTEPDPQTFVARLAVAAAGVWGRWSGKKAGYELTVRLPAGGGLVGEADLTGGVYGAPDAETVRAADDALTAMMDDVRRTVGLADDRRRSPRVPVEFPVWVYPITGDGCVFPAVAGVCRDVSVGGVRFTTAVPTEMQYVFVGFGRVPAVAGWCVLTKVLRSARVGGGHEYAGRFRTDL